MKPAPLVMLLLVATSGMPAGAAPRADLTVTVRTYNYARVPAAVLALARRAAERPFKNTGVTLRWIDCRVPDTDEGAACTEPVQARGDYILRLMDEAPDGGADDTGGAVALATSMLDGDRRTGVLMTVRPRAIGAIAALGPMDEPTLLGRAIAHELGHLLLGMSRHPRRGLMRALWSQAELQGLKPANWGFSAREAERMRRGLAAKSSTAN